MLGQKSILGMFARSPMRPLQVHMHKANACVDLLLPFYEAIQQSAWSTCQELYRKISKYEHEADEIKRDLRLHLPKSLFLPVPRGDLLVLLANQEMLANKAKDIAGIMLGRKMIFPVQLDQAFFKYLKRSAQASEQAERVINELDELLESGFRGREVTVVENMIKALDTIEHETDEMQIGLRQQLFEIETALQPVDVMFLYQIIDWVGCLADGAQQAGYQLQLLLAD